jgi:hypothetical protein
MAVLWQLAVDGTVCVRVNVMPFQKRVIRIVRSHKAYGCVQER